jgi:trans-2,3-dihydro-3-hydroxyanthranilate isomerase
VRSYAFFHVDVFTQTPFEGNPLAVFTDARELDDVAMQRIARELNLAETSFVFPPQDAANAAALRIFTPAAEVPFAGHPTIGTAFVLQQTGVIRKGRSSIVLEERVGPVRVEIEAGTPFRAWLTTPQVSFGERFADRGGIAHALGLDDGDLSNAAPVQVVTAGNPFLYVPLNDVAAVDRAALEPHALRRTIGEAATTGVYIFALRDGSVYSRMFAPEYGVVEDPATGSATGPLGAYLLAHGIVAARDPVELTVEQGTHMGRRSILRLRIAGSGSQRTIEVGGSAVALIEGTLRFP